MQEEYYEDDYAEPTTVENIPVKEEYVEPTTMNSPVEDEYEEEEEYEEPTGILLSIVSPDYARSKMHNLPWVEQQEIAKKLKRAEFDADDALKYFNCHTMCQLWTMLGLVYLNGLGVEEDYSRANEYFHLAAVPEESGNLLDLETNIERPYPLPKGPAEPIAQYHTGCYLWNHAVEWQEAGRIKESDHFLQESEVFHERAMNLLRKAAAQGHDDAFKLVREHEEKVAVAQEAQRYNEEMARNNAEAQRRQAEDLQRERKRRDPYAAAKAKALVEKAGADWRKNNKWRKWKEECGW